jgi:hypothetical protein
MPCVSEYFQRDERHDLLPERSESRTTVDQAESTQRSGVDTAAGLYGGLQHIAIFRHFDDLAASKIN